MLDNETKRRIDTARDILVGKVPDPKSQVEQITIALIYKFMDDMDMEAMELGGERTFFSGEFEKYAWNKIFDPKVGGYELLNLYAEAIVKLNVNPNIPQLFRDIFKNAYLPYRDPETLKGFLKIIDEFTYDHSERLGDAFEYLLSVLGSQGSAGQFRTPRHIIDFMAEVIDPKKDETILDPACGTAGFLISSYKHILKHNSSNFDVNEDKQVIDEKIKSLNELTLNSKKYKGDKLTPDERSGLAENIKGYDISPDMVRLSLVNMYLHGLNDPDIAEYDTLTSEDNWNKYADVILANPPFMSPKGGIRPHNRFTVKSNRSEVLFVDYIAEHLTPNGRAAVIVPEGIIFQSGKAYKQLRKLLVEEYLVGVISLPAGVFNPYSGVKTSILWLDKSLAKKTDKILFIKIENDGFDLGAQRRPIKQNDLPNALAAIKSYKEALVEDRQYESESFANTLVVEKSKIAVNDDYNLSGDRYRIEIFQKLTKYDLIPIGELCVLINGRAFKPSDWETEEKGGLPIIRIQNLNDPNAPYNFYSGYFQEKYLVQNSELLFSWSGSRGTSFGAHIWSGDDAILNQHIFKVKFEEKKVIKKYLYYALNQAVEEVEENLHGGVGLVHITKGNLEKIEIPIPPLFVQKEIVAEIEGYQKIIDGARQVVENYKPQIKIDPEWEMVGLKDICQNLDGKRVPITKSDRKEGTYPYYGASGVVDHVEGYLFDEDLLLVSEDGANLLARVTPIAFSVSGKVWVNNHAHVLKFENIETQKYVELYINSIDIKNYVTGAAQPKLNQKALNSITIPLPEFEIQKRIVEQIENEKNIIEKNKELIELYEQKIKDRIAEVWGEDKKEAKKDPKPYEIKESEPLMAAES